MKENKRVRSIQIFESDKELPKKSPKQKKEFVIEYKYDNQFKYFNEIFGNGWHRWKRYETEKKMLQALESLKEKNNDRMFFRVRQ